MVSSLLLRLVSDTYLVIMLGKNWRKFLYIVWAWTNYQQPIPTYNRIFSDSKEPIKNLSFYWNGNKDLKQFNNGGKEQPPLQQSTENTVLTRCIARVYTKTTPHRVSFYYFYSSSLLLSLEKANLWNCQDRTPRNCICRARQIELIPYLFYCSGNVCILKVFV